MKNYILLKLYISILLFYLNKGESKDTNFRNYFHDDTRGCLFDMCGRKEDIIIFYHTNIDKYIMKNISRALGKTIAEVFEM